MVAPYPPVDERRADELLAELVSMARAFLPAWSGATAEGDPGRALLRIGARLGEQVTSRLDKTPRRDTVAFFDALDIPPPAPVPAEVPLVFSLVPKRETTVFAPARVQVAGKSQEGEEVLFETHSGLELTPARLEYLAAVDSITDHIEEAPPGFLTVAPPELLPEYHVVTYSDAGSRVVQISPTEGLAENDVLRIEGTAYRIATADEGLFTLSAPLETAVRAGTQVSKVTTFESFSLCNLQRHDVYIGHGELLNLEQPSTITLVLSPQGAAERLRDLDVSLEIYGTKAGEDAPDWHALIVRSAVAGELRLDKTWWGPVEELEVNGRKARWIRLRLTSPVRGRVTEGTRISHALLRVASASPEPSAPGEGQTAEGSQTIKQAFHNSAPLSLSSRFRPFGSAPQRFDSFHLAAPEALSKKQASVTIDIGLVNKSTNALSVAQTLDGASRVYGVGTDGNLQRIDFPSDQGVDWRQLGHPRAEDLAGADAVPGQLRNPESLCLSAGLTPQAIEVQAKPSRDLVVVRDEGNRLWAVTVTRLGEVGCLSYRCEWVPLPLMPNGLGIDDVVLLPYPFGRRQNGDLLLFAASEKGLHVLRLNQGGLAYSSEWRAVVEAKGSESPAYASSDASFPRIRLLPVFERQWPRQPNTRSRQLILVDAKGLLWKGEVSDGAPYYEVIWKPLITPDLDRNGFSVNQDIKPVAAGFNKAGVIVYLVSAHGKLVAVERYDDKKTLTNELESDLQFSPDTELLCVPNCKACGSEKPIVLAFGDTPEGEAKALIWDSDPEKPVIFSRPAPVERGAKLSGVLLPVQNGEGFALRLILNGKREALFQKFVPPDALPQDMIEHVSESAPASWSTVPYDRGYQNPELSWEYFDGKTWRRIGTEFRDTTNNLSATGAISFQVPDDMSMVEVAGQKDYWIRARLIGGDYGRPKYIIETARQQDAQTHNVEVQQESPLELGVETTREPGTQTQTITVDTSELRPPEIQSIEARFELTECCFPDHVLVENNAKLLDQSQANRTPYAAFELFEGAAVLDADIQSLGRTLYLGFSRPFEVPSLNLFVDAEEQERETELGFEVLARDGWRRLRLNEEDPTRGFHRLGMVRVNVDTPPRRANLLGSERYWLRVYPRERTGDWAPHLKGIYANAVMAVQAQSIAQELLGSSLGEPNQRFYLSKIPVLADGLELRVRERLTEEEGTALAEEVGEEAVATFEHIPGDWVSWTRVDSFVGADGDARVYRLDPATGEVRFGDGRQGRIPPGGRDGIRAVRYRSGGGRQGNLAAYSIDKLKSSVESVEAVTNPIPAAGGVDALPIDQVIATAPARLRHRQQALTPTDIEAIALSWSPDLVRVRCLLPDDQHDYLRLVIARHREEPRPQPSLAEREALARYLRERAWGGLNESDIRVSGPNFAPVSVEVLILADSADRVSALEKQATERVRRLLHPTGGGPGGTGWPFGRRIWQSDVLRALSGLEGLDRIERVDIQPLDGTRLDDLAPTDLVCAEESDIRISVQLAEGGA